MSQDNTQRTSAEDLLALGLELYGQNKVADAVRCWQQVLSLSPGDRRALDYLDAAGAEATPAPVSAATAHGGVLIELAAAREARAATPPSVMLGDVEVSVQHREAMERLLRDKRYEEALQVLYKERERAPQDSSISRGIRVLKEQLVVYYGRELGSLDRVPVLVASEEVLSRLAPEQREVLRLLDGVATFGDVLGSSRFGRFETYRLLATLLKRGSITVRSPSVTMPAVRESAPPPARRAAEEPTPITRPSSGASSLGRYMYVAEESADDTTPPAPAPLSQASAPSFYPPPSRSDGDFDRIFGQATEAYLCKDHAEAIRLYEECLAVRPGDARAEHNLRKLRQLTGQ